MEQKAAVVDCRYPYELEDKIQEKIDRFKAKGYTLDQSSCAYHTRTNECFCVLIFKKE